MNMTDFKSMPTGKLLEHYLLLEKKIEQLTEKFANLSLRRDSTILYKSDTAPQSLNMRLAGAIGQKMLINEILEERFKEIPA